jgi:nucleoside-diphosphate-sugar epimerase
MNNSMRNFLEANKTPLIGIVAFTSFIFLTKRYYFSGGRFNDTKTKLTGKTVIITGANTGIGKETALDMARRGARVILACRDLTRANKAAEEIRKQTGNGNVLVESLDLASLDSIRKFSSRINSQEERIDILVNNAGIMACPQWKTKDGFEMQFGGKKIIF